MMSGGENGSQEDGSTGRRYTKEFKMEAVRLGQSVGYSEASRRLGMPESSLFNWVKLDRAGKLGTSMDEVLQILVVYRLLSPGSEWRLHREWY
jgi:transposase-like protein